MKPFSLSICCEFKFKHKCDNHVLFCSPIQASNDKHVSLSGTAVNAEAPPGLAGGEAG